MTAQINTKLSTAYERGRRAAEAAATHTEIPPTPPMTAELLIEWIDISHPSVGQYLPSQPNLSGEWGGSETSQTLVQTIAGSNDIDKEEANAICNAWESGVSDNFHRACIDEIKRQSERRQSA